MHIKGYISHAEVSRLIHEKYGFHQRHSAKRLIDLGVITKTKLFGEKKIILIKEEELEVVIQYLENFEVNYYTLEEVSSLDEFKGLKGVAFLSRLMNNYFKTAMQHPLSNKIRIVTKKEIDEFREQFYYKDRSLHHKSYLNDKQARELLGVHQSTLKSYIKNDAFPNHIFVQQHNFIPREDIIAYKNKQLELKNTQQKTYDKKQALLDMQNYLNTYPVKESYIETIKLYKEFCEIHIQKTNTLPVFLKAKVNQFRKFINILIGDSNNNQLLKKEIFLLDNDELEQISKIMSDVQYLYMIFTTFLSYCYNKKGIKPKRTFKFSVNKERKSEKEIYSPKEFYDFYNYILDLDNHVEKALVSNHHANMWAYCIVLMTDAWSGSDIINKMPHIAIEEMGVHSFEWFETNRLTNKQSQHLIEQLYIQLRGDLRGKTGAFLNFIVEPNLVVPLAHSLTISELHRRKHDSEYILQTFISETSLKQTSTNGKRGHRHFLKDCPLPNFKSRKLTITVMTYLFHSVAEDVDGDADIALDINRHLRSHKSTDTTEIYVQTTNKDGHIEQVSLQLFRRGLFGWLYNYLIMLAFQNEEFKPTLEERTKQIESLRQEYPSPRDIESLGVFFYHKNDITPFGVYEGNMPKFIADIIKRRSTLVTKLLNLPRAEIRSLLYKLAKGEMPSRNENAQCMVFPDCQYPTMRNCYSCEYVVPKQRLLIELKSEFNRIIDSIHTSRNENIIKKESKFLADIMVLVSEAIEAYGENSKEFLNLEDIQEGCLKIANQINIDYFQGRIGK